MQLLTFSFLSIFIPLGRGNTLLTENNDLTKKYGDACESMEYCHGELVNCQQGFCSCFSKEDMVYDELSKGCVVLAGKKCEINSEIWKVNVNCVKNAFCDKNGICICEENFYEHNGTCLPEKRYEQDCFHDLECETHVCLNGICACDKRGQIYDAGRGACVGVVDSECDSDFQCISNALCDQGRCKCKEKYAKSSSQECKLGFGATCNPTDGQNCADIHFVCVNGQCVCKHPLHQIYDEASGECLSLVSGPCTFPKKDFKEKNVTGLYDIQKCIKNTICVDKGFYSECICRLNYVENLSGTCSPGFGESCEQNECDPITPLYCKEGKCDCYDSLFVFDPTIKKCVGLVGSRCAKEEPYCVEFASCVVPGSKITGKCLCDKYSEDVANRTCVYKS